MFKCGRIISSNRFSYGFRGCECLPSCVPRQRRSVSSTPAFCKYESQLESVEYVKKANPPRFYVNQSLVGQPQGWLCQLGSAESRHTKTLRIKEGAIVQLCDGHGALVQAEVVDICKSGVTVRTLEPSLQVRERGWLWQVAVACGSLKGGRADWLVEKSVELGASDFIPLVTHRSPVIGSSGNSGNAAPHDISCSTRNRKGKATLEAADIQESLPESGREGRWQRLAIAALKQSLRVYGMQVHSPQTVQGLCEIIKNMDAAFIGVAGAPPLREAAVAAIPSLANPDMNVVAVSSSNEFGPLRGTQSGISLAEPRDSDKYSASVRHGLIVVGPEGDFTAVERQQLVNAGCVPVSLGDLRLRAETAAIAMLSYLRLHSELHS